MTKKYSSRKDKAGRKPKFRPEISRVKLNPEQAVLVCDCYTSNWRIKYLFRGGWRLRSLYPTTTAYCYPGRSNYYGMQLDVMLGNYTYESARASS